MSSLGRVLSRALACAAAAIVIVACSSPDGDPLPPGPPEGEADGAVAANDAASGTDAATRADAGDGGATFSGEATYYATDGRGACGFPASPNDLLVVAMNKAQYSKAVCGKCVLVTGPKGTVKARVVDLCPGCGFGSLDLSEQAFAKISPLSAGRVKITWSFVPC